MRIPYDASIVPPAPFVPVRLSNLAGGPEAASVPAKIDTGADVSAVPTGLVNQLGLVPAGEIQVEGYDGQISAVHVYDVVLGILDLRIIGLAVIAIPENYVLLGRDVLNTLRLLFDGPALVLEILPPA